MSSPSALRRPKATKKHLHRVSITSSPGSPPPSMTEKRKTRNKNKFRKAKILTMAHKKTHRTCVPKYHFYRFSVK